MTLNVNLVTPTSFELVIHEVPRSAGEETANVLLKLFGTVIPAMDMNEIEQMWQGHKVGTDVGGGILWGDWTVSYFVNSDFSNWRTLYDWMMYCARGPLDHTIFTINATLLAKDNFGNVVLTVRFAGVWIKNLGEVTLSTQSGDDYLQSTATFSYNEFTVHGPGEVVTSERVEGLVL